MSTKPIPEIRSTWHRRKNIGTQLALRKIGGIVNETGIEAAGERSLPFYWLLGNFALPIAAIVLTAVLGVAGSIGEMLGLLFTIVVVAALVAAWPLSALVIYWDCKAAERYADLSFGLGKVMAATAIVLGPAAIFFYLLYRIVKF